MMKRTLWDALRARCLWKREREHQTIQRQRSVHANLHLHHRPLRQAISLLILLWSVLGTPLSVLAHTARETEQYTSSPSNLFPYPQCTWWANERYHQLHGIFVPWTRQADAWQWADRADEFGWQRSATPLHTGSIIVLQPGIQGTLGLGHVAVVEQILANGHVLTSNLNWGTHPKTVTTVEFAPGPGVSFIDQSAP